MPEFFTSPPATVEVNENSNLEIAIEMDGNPAPSADFLWPHLGDGGTTVAGNQIYPYVYSAKFSHPNIAASYCGRILKSSMKNSIGSSLAKGTNVTVLCKCFMLIVIQNFYIFTFDFLKLKNYAQWNEVVNKNGLFPINAV